MFLSDLQKIHLSAFAFRESQVLLVTVNKRKPVTQSKEHVLIVWLIGNVIYVVDCAGKVLVGDLIPPQ
jgi:hypothetical protein